MLVILGRKTPHRKHSNLKEITEFLHNQYSWLPVNSKVCGSYRKMMNAFSQNSVLHVLTDDRTDDPFQDINDNASDVTSRISFDNDSDPDFYIPNKKFNVMMSITKLQ